MQSTDDHQTLHIPRVALYHHFLLYVEGCNEDISASFTNESITDRLTIKDCIAAINTISSGTIEVLVHITILDSRPVLEIDKWDHVVEFSMDVCTGRLVVANSFYTPTIDPIVTMVPGIYRFRVHHGDMAAVISTYYAGNNDITEHIWISVWSESYSKPVMLKRYPG